MLTVIKVFNNNAVQAKNDSGSELVVLGKGIAFGKKCGEPVDETLIEKTFSLNTSPFATRLTEILNAIPSEYFRLTDRIVNYANQQLGTRLSNSIYVSLTDHIYHAVQRAQHKLSGNNAFTFEIARLYKQEYAIGKYATQLIENDMQLKMDDDEAGFIALHIVNARTDTEQMSDTYRTTQIIRDILNLVKYHFNLQFDENSLDYDRFVTHLQYFAQRLFTQQSTAVSSDDFLYQQTKLTYPDAYQCVEKINKYLESTFDKCLNHDEQLYLVIHIHRVVG